jgi:hypothetical protein
MLRYDQIPSNISVLVRCWNRWQGRTLPGRTPSMPNTGLDMIFANWIRIYFVKPTSSTWNRDRMLSLQDLQAFFFPLNHVPFLSTDAISGALVDFCKYMSDPVLEALSPSQFGALPSFCISSFPVDTWKNIPASKIRSLTGDQISGFSTWCSTSQFSVMKCPQLEAFSWSEMNSYYVASSIVDCYIRWYKPCNPNSPIFAPKAAPTSLLTPYNRFPPTPSQLNNPLGLVIIYVRTPLNRRLPKP